MSFILFSLCSCFSAFHFFILKLKSTNVKMWRHPPVLSAAAAAAAWPAAPAPFRQVSVCLKLPRFFVCTTQQQLYMWNCDDSTRGSCSPWKLLSPGSCCRSAAPHQPTAGQTPGGQNPNLKVRILNSEARNMILTTFLSGRYICLKTAAHYNRQINHNIKK